MDLEECKYKLFLAVVKAIAHFYTSPWLCPNRYPFYQTFFIFEKSQRIPFRHSNNEGY